MVDVSLVLPFILVAQVAVTAVGPTSAPTEATAAFERGRRLYELGTDMKGAYTALTQAVELKPDYAEAYMYRALVAQDVKGLDASRQDFEFALRLAPDSKETHRYYGEALADAGDAKNAEAEYQKALALDPNYAEPDYLLGRLYRKQGDLDKAISFFDKAASLDAKGSAHHDLGEIYLEKGDDARAAKEFELDLDADATCYESRINLAGLELDDGKVAEAKTQYETSLQYHPADARALSGLGRAYLRLGDYEMAVGTLRSALDLAPDDTQVKHALKDARGKLRVRYGWPFAAVPGAAFVLLLGFTLLRRRA